jgi:hypothetical protein
MEKLDTKICDICFVTLQSDNTTLKQDSHYIDTCKEHSEHAKTFLSDLVAEKLGFKDVSVKNCEICKSELSTPEIETCLELNSFHLLCFKHISKHDSYMLKNTQQK